MEVLLQGKFTADQDMLEVLNDVLALPGSSVGVLRISNPDDNLNGRVTIYKRRYIIGASISECPDTGYKAVRRLLSVHAGNFAYMETGEDEPPKDMSEPMCLDLKALMEYVPDLPEYLPAPAEAPDVLPASEVAVNGLMDAIETVRISTEMARTTDPEAACPTKLRSMKRGIRWSKIAAIGFVLGVLGAGLNYSMPYVMNKAQFLVSKLNVQRSSSGEVKSKAGQRREAPRHASRHGRSVSR